MKSGKSGNCLKGESGKIETGKKIVRNENRKKEELGFLE